MFENIIKFFKRFGKNEKENSKSTAKERLHLVLAQDRANISADFLEMMKQEIIEVIKKYIDIDEEAIDVKMTNKPGEDGVVGAPALYANIPIVTIKNEARKLEGTIEKVKNKEENQEVEREENIEESSAKEEMQEQDDDVQDEIEKQNEENIEVKEDEIEQREENKKELQEKQQDTHTKEEKKKKVKEEKNEKKNS